MIKRRAGIYFLADDGVADLCIAFLNSLRATNGDLAVYCIPYSANYGQILKLRKSYQFSIFEDRELLKHYDSVSKEFHGSVVGDYRKLACWEGPLDDFVWIDVDTIVLGSLRVALNFLNTFDLINSHSNIESSVRYTWKSSILGTHVLKDEQISYAGNMGFCASQKRKFTRAQIDNAVVDSLKIREHMELSCMGQPFMNYLFVTSGLNYTSLHLLRNRLVNVPHEIWAGDPNWRVDLSNRWWYRNEPRDALFIHWAGLWRQKTRVVNEKELEESDWRRKFNLSPTINRDLPLRDLWLKYRLA